MTIIWDNNAHNPSATVELKKFSIFNKSGAAPSPPANYPYVDELNDYAKIYIDGVLLAEDLYTVRNFKVPVDRPVTIRIELMNDLRFLGGRPILAVNRVWHPFATTEGKIGISQSYAEITHTFNPDTIYEFELYLRHEPMIRVSHEGEGTQLVVYDKKFANPDPVLILGPGESGEIPANVLKPISGGYMFRFKPLEGYELTGEGTVWKEKTQSLWLSASYYPEVNNFPDIIVGEVTKELGNLLTHMTAKRIITEPVKETRTFMFTGSDMEALIYTRATVSTPSYLYKATAGKTIELEYGKPYDITIRPEVGYEFTSTGTVSYGMYPGHGTPIPLEVSISNGQLIRTVSVESLENNMFITLETRWAGVNPTDPPVDPDPPVKTKGLIVLKGNADVRGYINNATEDYRHSDIGLGKYTFHVDFGNDYDIVLFAWPGYEFSSIGTYSYTEYPTESEKIPLKIQKNTKPGYGTAQFLTPKNLQSDVFIQIYTNKEGEPPTLPDPDPEPPVDPNPPVDPEPSEGKRLISLNNNHVYIYIQNPLDESFDNGVLPGKTMELESGKPYIFTAVTLDDHIFTTTGWVSHVPFPSEEEKIPLTIPEGYGDTSREFSVDSLQENMYFHVDTEYRDPNPSSEYTRGIVVNRDIYGAFGYITNVTDNDEFFIDDDGVYNADFGKEYKIKVYPVEGYEFSSIGSASHVRYPSESEKIPLTEKVDSMGDTYQEFLITSLLSNVFINIFTNKIGEEPTDPEIPVDPDPEIPVDPEDPSSPPGGSLDPAEILGFNNIYAITKEQLVQIHKDIYKQMYDWGDINTREPINPYNYLINTLRLPFEVPIYNFGPNNNVKIGYHTLTSRVRTLTRDKFILDMGSISVGHKYKNSYDFKNTDVIIHLPYINSVTIDPSYAIGQTISIQYVVDAYTGETTVNLSSTLTRNNIFYSAKTMIGNTIPVIAPRTSEVVGNLSASKAVLNNNTPIPFVEVIRNIPYQLDSEFNSDTLETVKTLHNIKGRVYVHNISLESDCTVSEQLSIKAILAGGVNIK